MGSMTFKTLLASVLMLGLVSNANAITFDLTQSSSYTLAPSIQILDTTGIYSLTASGLALSVARDVVRNETGLGVVGDFLDDPQVDGLGMNETLVLDLGSNAFLLTAVTFTKVGTNDDFTLLVNDVVQLANEDIPGGNIFDTGISNYNFNPQLLGSVFKFTVAGINDDYKLSRAEFQAVPEPASLALLSAGLLGLGFRRNRKSRA